MEHAVRDRSTDDMGVLRGQSRFYVRQKTSGQLPSPWVNVVGNRRIFRFRNILTGYEQSGRSEKRTVRAGRRNVFPRRIRCPSRMKAEYLPMSLQVTKARLQMAAGSCSDDPSLDPPGMRQGRVYAMRVANNDGSAERANHVYRNDYQDTSRTKGDLHL